MKRMMFAAASLMLVMGSADAMERYNMASMSCEQIQSALKRDGKAILRSESKNVPGMMLYNTYVAERGMCGPMQAPTNRRIKTADGSCLVFQCVATGHSWMRP